MGDLRASNRELLSGGVNYWDLAVLYGIAVSLLTVHLLFPGMKYVLRPTDSPILEALALIASTFVHTTWTHLLTNVGWYIVLVTGLYATCSYLELLDYFRATFATILLGTALVGNFLATVVHTLLYPGVRISSVGFSGVVSALVGWLFVLLLLYFATVFRTQTVLYIGWLYTFLALGVLIWIHDISPVLRWLVAVGISFSGLGVLRRASKNPQIGWDPSNGPQAKQATAMLIAGGCLLLAFISSSFSFQGGQGALQNGLTEHSVGLFMGIGSAISWALYFELLATNVQSRAGDGTRQEPSEPVSDEFSGWGGYSSFIMPDIEVTNTCEDGYTVESIINGEWELIVDALANDGPSPNEVLVADYASCYIPALRVAADQHGYDDIGEIEIEVSADLDEDDDLETIDFDLTVEEDLGDDARDIVELGEEICHVHSALIEELHADISVESGV